MPPPPGLLQDAVPTPRGVRISTWLWLSGMGLWLSSAFVVAVPRRLTGTIVVDALLTTLFLVLIIRMRRRSGTARVLLTIFGLCDIAILGTASGLYLTGHSPGSAIAAAIVLPLWLGVMLVTLPAIVFMYRGTWGWFHEPDAGSRSLP